MKTDFTNLWQLVEKASSIIIIQAENPDIDSLGSSLALEDILTQVGKKVSMYCPVDLPKYIRYVDGWDRVTNHFDYKAELGIIVDTASDILLSKLLSDPVIRNWLESKPSIAIDHHSETESSLPFKSHLILRDAVATAEVVYDISKALNLSLSADAATYLVAAINGDTLGLSTPNVTAKTFRMVADLVDSGANPSAIEDARQSLNKKPAGILSYKGDLIKRIEYHADDRLATIHIPFEDIQKYSDLYNPSVLVLEEMRLVEGVEVAVAFKTYPDGKVTGKIRSNKPIANTLAGYFGGGGHAYASGFRVYDDYDKILIEVIEQTRKILDDEII